ILPLFLLAAIGLAAFTNLRLTEWAVVWLSFSLTLGLLTLSYLQVRWLGLYAALNAWLAVVTGVCAWRLLRERLPARIQFIVGSFVVAFLLCQPVFFAKRRIDQV